MSLRLIARDLYRLQQKVDRLEKKLAERELIDCPLATREEIKRKLARTKSERDQIRRVLDGRLDR